MTSKFIFSKLQNLTLRFKVSCAIFMTTFFCLSLSSFFTSQNLVANLESELGTRLEHIAKTAALTLPRADHSKIIEAYLSGESDIHKKPYFLRVQNFLQQVQTQNNLESDVYTVIRPEWKPDIMLFIAMSNEKTYSF